MKKQSFTLLIACLFLAKGISQQVEQQQRSLVTKRTADWCPYCGSWGWNFFEDAIEQNGDKAVYIAAHYSGGLAIDAATDITENFGGGYQPRFFLNATDQGVTSGNGNTKLTNLKSEINDNFAQSPIANCGFEPVYQNGEIKVAAKVKFFQAAQGEYQLGVYLTENNVTAYQANIGNSAVHKYLLRHNFTDETFGQPIVDGNVSAGQEFDLNFSLPLGNPSGHDYEVVGIIWKKDGDKFVPVNVWGTDEIGTATGTIVEDKANRLTLAPSVATDIANISIQLIEDQPVATVEVLDLNGRLVATLHNGFLKRLSPLIPLSKLQVGSTGLYFVRLSTPGFVIMEKVIFQ